MADRWHHRVSPVRSAEERLSRVRVNVGDDLMFPYLQYLPEFAVASGREVHDSAIQTARLQVVVIRDRDSMATSTIGATQEKRATFPLAAAPGSQFLHHPCPKSPGYGKFVVRSREDPYIPSNGGA